MGLRAGGTASGGVELIRGELFAHGVNQNALLHADCVPRPGFAEASRRIIVARAPRRRHCVASDSATVVVD